MKLFDFISDLHIGDAKFEVLEGTVRVSPVVLMQDDFFRDHLDYGFDFYANYNLRTRDVNIIATYYPSEGDGFGEVVNLSLTQHEKSELIDSMEAFCLKKYRTNCLALVNIQRKSVGLDRIEIGDVPEVHAAIQRAIGEFAADGVWLDEDDLEEMGKQRPDLEDAIDYYLHGNCDDWVLEHFQPGDVAVVWLDVNEDDGGVALIHCYIQRGDVFLDVRGETDDEELVEDGFEYGYDNEKVYCDTLEEYKEVIRDICGYEDEKWKAETSSLDEKVRDAEVKKTLPSRDEGLGMRDERPRDGTMRLG